MSVTAAERANPPPRRKSCAACTRAKRRCDLAWPTCQRCAGRGLTCDYPQRRGPVSTSVSLSPAPAVSAAPDFSIDALMDDFWNSEACAVDPLPLPDFAAPALEMQREIPDKAALPVPPGPFSATLLRGDDQKQLVRLGPCEADGTAKSAEGVPCSLQFINERLEYLFEKLPETPRELVETLGTAWCHPCVFKDVRPKVYDDLLSFCALYTSRNRANKPVVMRILVVRMQELAASPAPTNPYEALAHTLALTVYHIIACLDGDVESRAAAEATLSSLQPAARSLIRHANLGIEPTYPATLQLYPLAETESFWKSWILTESIRRTMFFAHQFHACYLLLRGASPVDCREMSKVQAWTLSAPLWNADNAVDFAVAWGSKNRWIMTVSRCDGALEAAAPEDVCKFGRLAMTCFMGRQEARGWFAARGGEL